MGFCASGARRSIISYLQASASVFSWDEQRQATEKALNLNL
jgi:hypothetical protein